MSFTLATLDYETDPFLAGRVPRVFAAGFYDGDVFISLWREDAATAILDAIKERADRLGITYLIYAHNGGKFDFFFILPSLSGSLRIVNNRIISANLDRHELRDSYAILPFPLREYDKLTIDISKLEAAVRNDHRDEILEYLKRDCTSLHELVTAFHAEFGDKLTVGGSSLHQLKQRHKFKTGGKSFDTQFRDRFYFGGRVQVFQPGIHTGQISVYDVNSMYPDVMAHYLHPIGTDFEVGTRVKGNTCFVIAEGLNYGAFPIRADDGSLSFTQEAGRFCATIHEWNAAEETGTFKPQRIIKTFGCDSRITFTEFVYHFYGERKLAKARNDKIRALFYKYVLNSAYGKFAQNPENFFDYQITGLADFVDGACISDCVARPASLGVDEILCPLWHRAYLTDEYCIWRKPTERKTYYNVTTGASITGAARAVLLRGLSHADNALYCDTDSIICHSLRSVALDSSDLGAWKLEATGNVAAICAKKIYAIWRGDDLFGAGECIKKASKGALLSPEEIYKIAQGETVTWESQVPAFRLGVAPTFVKRRIRKTV